MIDRQPNISTERLQELCGRANVFELEERREQMMSLITALIARDLEPHLLEQMDDGWYLDGYRLGPTIKTAYLFIVRL